MPLRVQRPAPTQFFQQNLRTISGNVNPSDSTISNVCAEETLVVTAVGSHPPTPPFTTSHGRL